MIEKVTLENARGTKLHGDLNLEHQTLQVQLDYQQQ